MRDPGPFDGDFAEVGFLGEGSGPAALDAATALTVPPLEHQFVVGLLDEGAEEPPLDLEAGAVDARLDPVGKVLVLVGHGQGHPEPELQRERLTVAVDGSEGDGSLEVVGVTHGESPYWT